MAKRKKRGFIIIEAIIAIAIFAIAATAISVAINTSSNMYKQENVRLQTISAADSIIHQLRSRGVGTKFVNNGEINGLIDFFGDDSSTEKYYYLYFDYVNSKDLNTVVTDRTKYKVTGTENNFQECKDYGNTASKKFGALVHIKRTNSDTPDLSKNLTIDWYYNVYTIDVQVWKLNQEYPAAHVTTSVSR